MTNFKKDFPILNTKVNGKPLVYLDNAATTQKPKQVIESIKKYYEETNANVHRGIHYLSEKASLLYDGTRQEVAKFLNAQRAEEIVYTRGATESLNLIAQGWAKKHLQKGDVIILTVVNHHSNIVPWQMLAKEKGLEIKWVDIDQQGNLNLDQYDQYLEAGKVKLVCLTHISNTLGTVYSVKNLIKKAHENGAKVVLDGAQSAPHVKIDVQACDCDFFVFSGHKMLAPTGIGVLYSKYKILKDMDPYQGGGDMIMIVEKAGYTTNHIPHNFEAGTPNVAGVAGLKSALEYLNKVGLENIKKHEEELTNYTLEQLEKVDGVEIYGLKDPLRQIGVVAFNLKNIHPHDVAAHLDTFGVAVRAGNHCTQPLHQDLGINASVRASFYIYNTKEDVDTLVEGIKDCLKVYA